VTSSKRNEPVAVRRTVDKLPRLPLEGSIDLTYRCNNACRHCWLWTADTKKDRARELSVEEWRGVVDQARAMGCRRWAISGGEPMLRADFAEIFDYVTSKSASYSLNTNGTLITPEIAQLMKRKGSKMVALYGATDAVHDHITRAPGSYAATMEGFARLREAGAGFTVQIVPMRDNYHELAAMEELAQSLSSHYRIGAPWLYMTACHSAARNAEITRQRLTAAEVVALDAPDVSASEVGASAATPDWMALDGGDEPGGPACARPPVDDRLYAGCIENRRDFHVDPYGGMTFCSFVKDPELRYDLRKGSFREGWDEFIPALADKVCGGSEYRQGCAACDLRADCRWCDVYGFLEHGRHGAKVDHLCDVAVEGRSYQEAWARDHRRYYEIAGITVAVESDLPIDGKTFHRKFKLFEVDGPGEDTITLRHHFGLPDLGSEDIGEEVYRKAPWAIYRKGASWIYVGIAVGDDDDSIHRVAVFNDGHTAGRLYNDDTREDSWHKGRLESLTMFPTDQILLARVLADREACYLHSGAVVLNGVGLMFVGHSTAGKSTTMKLLARELGDQVEILCDDRNIVRRWVDGYKVHGTWSHGTVPHVSAGSAPLGAILFISKAKENRLMRLEDRKQILARLLACLIKPHVDAGWWHKNLDLVEKMTRELPFYEMRFDKSGAIVPMLKQLAEERARELATERT
jgi:MoaA/NifB/PqqE/SkfB family radical SAM enzyme